MGTGAWTVESVGEIDAYDDTDQIADVARVSAQVADKDFDFNDPCRAQALRELRSGGCADRACPPSLL